MKYGTLIITQEEIRKHLSPGDYISAIEDVHRQHATKMVYQPAILHADVLRGEFHIKTGGVIENGQEYYGLKSNGGFFRNHVDFELPNILGIIYICDATNGYPLAIMDSTLISKNRTSAATVVAAKCLAPKNNIHLGVFGYGNQAEAQIKAVSDAFQVEQISIAGRNMEKAKQFAISIGKELGIATHCESIEHCARNNNFLITTTPAREFYIKKEWVNGGTFIAAIGADSPGKNELDPHLVASSTVVADIKEQVCRVGESQHAIRMGLMESSDIYADLGELLTGQKEVKGEDGVIIYDSTGTALQDIGVGLKVYRKVLESNSFKHIINLFQ